MDTNLGIGFIPDVPPEREVRLRQLEECVRTKEYKVLCCIIDNRVVFILLFRAVADTGIRQWGGGGGGGGYIGGAAYFGARSSPPPPPPQRSPYLPRHTGSAPEPLDRFDDIV